VDPGASEGLHRHPQHRDHRRSHGPRYRHPPEALAAQVRQLPGVSSVQITFHENKEPEHHAMPPGGFRLAIINAFNLQAGRAGREMLRTHFLARAA